LQNKLKRLNFPLKTGGFFMTKTIKLILLLTACCGLLAGVVFFALSGPQPDKRYVVFAGYNADGTIHPYVVTYLKRLNEVSDGVVYITDSPLKLGEESKIKGLTIHNEFQRHGEYDWGSYKRGFLWLKSNGYLRHAKEVVFANDSCYAVRSFKPMFADMDKRADLDFWGAAENIEFTTHVQSYFFAVRQKMLRLASFYDYLNIVEKKQHWAEFIAYEVMFTPTFAELGHKWGVWIPFEEIVPRLKSAVVPNVTMYPLLMLRDYNFPLLKRRVFGEMLSVYDDRVALLKYLKKNFTEVYERDVKPEVLQSKYRGLIDEVD
jgi:lipopolysaccharide biosynthesis protein